MKKDKTKIIISIAPKGIKYADFIGKEINLKWYDWERIKSAELRDYIARKKLLPKKILIHARTAGESQYCKIYAPLIKKGYKVINPPSVTKLTSNKYLCAKIALKKGIVSPMTFKLKRKEVHKLKKIVNKYKEVVIKPIASRGQGEHCFKISKDNIEDLKLIKKIPTFEVAVQERIDY